MSGSFLGNQSLVTSMFRMLAGLALLFSAGNVAADLSDSLTEIETVRSPGFADAEWLNPEFSHERLQDKVVLVNFWATWCPPCVEELPLIASLRSTLAKDDFEVVAINTGESRATVERFLRDWELANQFPVMLDEDLNAYNDWDVNPLPTTYLIDRSGRFRYRAVGGRDFQSENILAVIQRLIDE